MGLRRGSHRHECRCAFNHHWSEDGSRGIEKGTHASAAAENLFTGTTSLFTATTATVERGDGGFADEPTTRRDAAGADPFRGCPAAEYSGPQVRTRTKSAGGIGRKHSDLEVLQEARRYQETGEHSWRRRADYDRFLAQRFPDGIPGE